MVCEVITEAITEKKSIDTRSPHNTSTYPDYSLQLDYFLTEPRIISHYYILNKITPTFPSFYF